MKAFEMVSFLKEKGITASLIGNKNRKIEQVASLSAATSVNLSFFNDSKRIDELNSTKAGVVILVKNADENISSTKIYVEDPYVAYALLAKAFNPVIVYAGISKTAVIADSAIIPKSCQIEPNVIIESDVHIGENCIIRSGAIIKKKSKLGNDTVICSNVVIEENCQVGSRTSIEAGSIIGGQGFGFANNKGQWIRIPQIGRVVIGNDVWIGNNCSIDRGTLNDTIIEDNCIIDNLVHIAHNVEIGSGSAIAGQVGFAGSSKIGKYNIFAGQVGMTGHIETADNAHFGAKSGITNNIKEAGSYSGFPAVETATWQKTTIRVKSLDKMAKRIKSLEKQLKELITPKSCK